MSLAPDIEASLRELATHGGDARAVLERVRAVASQAGVQAQSLQPVYAAFARGELPPFTVPAVNLRGLTYPLARALWRAAIRSESGPIMFELAPIEAVVGRQTLHEYAAMVLAAAVREGYQGPVFLQGDHFSLYESDEAAVAGVEATIGEALDAGFSQMDFDTAALGEHGSTDPADRQGLNAQLTARLVTHARTRASGPLCLGGEVGEIGGSNTTPADMRAFLSAVRERVPAYLPALDKVSIQTGTSHGGQVLADGSTGRMPLDVGLARELSAIARHEYGLGGVVQHGASTLALDQLATLPEAGVIEVHLATGVQNLLFDHPEFPRALRNAIAAQLEDDERNAEGGKSWLPADATPEQRFYSNRWRAWGTHKRELWEMPQGAVDAIGASLEGWFRQLLTALQVAGKRGVLEQLYREGARP